MTFVDSMEGMAEFDLGQALEVDEGLTTKADSDQITQPSSSPVAHHGRTTTRTPTN